ncbi:outer membrane protein [Rickettsiella massiliensis]|uniref:outer membrane protein n=1 Tax=Rickettsiella massiliensis TaxID=676517 RepID=UPI00029A0077|nr:hypothetical protein [Rickettsiella massiliensis]
MQNKANIFFLSNILLLVSISDVALASHTTYIRNPLLDSRLYKIYSTGYFDFSLGHVFSQKIEDSYLYQKGFFPDFYFANHIKKTTLFSLSGGYLWKRPSVWFPYTSIGLEYSSTAQRTLTGLIADYSDLKEINHCYQYKIREQNLRLVTQINTYYWHGWMPFIQLGVGTAWTKYNEYHEIVLLHLPSHHLDPQFPQKTISSFAYHASFGINYIINKNLWMGLSYRFDDFGKGQTGETRPDNYLKGHLTNYLQAHSVLFSLRYLFN